MMLLISTTSPLRIGGLQMTNANLIQIKCHIYAVKVKLGHKIHYCVRFGFVILLDACVRVP